MPHYSSYPHHDSIGHRLEFVEVYYAEQDVK